MSSPSILIRATNWVGDAVLTTPVYRALRRNYPGARITVVARPWVADLLAGNPNVDEVVVEQGHGLRATWATGRQLRAAAPSGYDIGLSLPNSWSAALLLRIAGARRLVGFALGGRGFLLTDRIARPGWLLREHQVEYYLYLLRDLCADFGDVRRLEIALREADHAKATEVLAPFLREGEDASRPLVGMAPGAAFGTAKRWPAERYAELAARLARDTGARIVLVGSRNEQEVAGRILAHVGQHHPAELPALLDTCGAMPLRATAALLERCTAFVTNDSGAMHIAAALQVPMVAIFGPTDWITTPPYRAPYRLVRDPTDCAPCLLRHCPIDHRCMTKISVDRVLGEVMALLRPSEGGEGTG